MLVARPLEFRSLSIDMPPRMFWTGITSHPIIQQMQVDWTQHIERDARIMLGKAVFKGTRLTVAFVLDRLAQGADIQELCDNYEELTPERISAALAYAAATVRDDVLVTSNLS